MSVCYLVDYDECLSPDSCGSEHVCNNTVGSYACECQLGFVTLFSPQNPRDIICLGEALNLVFVMTHSDHT